MTYAITSLIVFTTYIVFCLLKFGVLKSVSASYYALHDKAIFQASLIAFSVTAIIAGTTPLMFLAGSGIVFVAFAPEYKIKMEGDVHVVAAYSGIILGMAQMLLWGFWPLFVVMAASTILLRLFAKNYTYWIELLAFYLIITGLIIHNL